MYIALLAVLLALSAALLRQGVQRSRPRTVAAGVFVLLLTALFFGLLSFWGEMLWFDALGYGQRFWTVVYAQVGYAILGALVGGLSVYLLTLPIPTRPPLARFWPESLGAAVGGLWGFTQWQTILQYLYRVSTAVADPILHRDISFYLFVLPFFDAVYWMLLGITSIALAAVLVYALDITEHRSLRGEQCVVEAPSFERDISLHRLLRFPLAALALVVAWGNYLNSYHLMYSHFGVVTGAGWTDVHIRLPGYYMVAGVTLLLGLLPLLPGISHRMSARVPAQWLPAEAAPLTALAAPWVGIGTLWLLMLGVAPGLVQWLLVEPNEITLEAPYIAHNIEFTRRGFQLDKVEEREFPVSQAFTQETVDHNHQLLSEVRLWDGRALSAVYQQFQEIRLYYEFPDVDVDRYYTNHEYRQVMVSAREMELANLPAQSQTFVNQRFKYTHGYGVTMAPVSAFTADGLPNLLIKDIPPRTDYARLQIDRPQIYYGELTHSHVFVNTTEPEFDYPSGDENVYLHYPGSGDVRLTNLWRKFVFGWKFDGTRFLLSTYPTPDSRVLFHRQIHERVKRLAPFLEFDADPYIVLMDGKLYWIIDGYTTSRGYPYSTPFSGSEVIEYEHEGRGRTLSSRVATSLYGANYVRNAVKAVVDAFNGTVTFYVFEPEDPLIQVWQRIFPALFSAQDQMPEGLRAHARYPSDFLVTQGLVYAKYHMTDPAVFYNQEDLWMRATEKYYSELQPIQPYYVMWEPPDAQAAEFVLMLPFTPKNRQVMIGWIAGMCDPGNYGRLLAYKFPKEERVLGPQQVETKIDQDRFLSAQLSLWDQHGSRVIRGNVLAIPINHTLLYVEPIYLQAEAAAYPELRLVAVMHGDNLSYAETFDKALQGLLTAGGQRLVPVLPQLVGTEIPLQELIPRANTAFENYLRLQGEGRFVEAAEELVRLRAALQQLAKQVE